MIKKEIQIMDRPIQAKLNALIEELAQVLNAESIIIVHPVTWDELIEELLLDVQHVYPPEQTSSTANLFGCSYKGIKVYRSQDYALNEWGIYL